MDLTLKSKNVLHECEHPAVKQTKQNMYTDIAACISEALPDESLKQWVSDTAIKFWEGDTDALQNDSSLVTGKIEGMCLN